MGLSCSFFLFLKFRYMNMLMEFGGSWVFFVSVFFVFVVIRYGVGVCLFFVVIIFCVECKVYFMGCVFLFLFYVCVLVVGSELMVFFLM